MKKITKTKSILFSILVVGMVGSFFWLIINFSMNIAGFENLIKINVAEAAQLIEENKDNPDFVIVDVRTYREYYNDHIKNAILIAYPEKDFDEQLQKLDKGKTYLFYCWEGRKIKHIRAKMKKAGFEKAYFMKGGYSDWVDEGYPIVDGRASK